MLSDPQANGGWVVLVRVTTDDGDWRVRVCLLGPMDWTELDHASTVAYSTAKTGQSIIALTRAVQQGHFEVIASPPANVLQQMVSIGKTYRGTPPLARQWLT